MPANDSHSGPLFPSPATHCLSSSSKKGSTPSLHTESPPFTSLKILIAEDDNINRLFLSHLLAKIGHEVITVKDGKECLKALEAEQDIHVILTDIQMPHMDGLELCRTLRVVHAYQRYAHLPIVAMTAYGAPGDQQKYLAAGIDEYIEKPITPNLLQRVLSNLTGRLQ